MGNVVDAVERFEMVRHRNLVLVAAEDFVSGKLGVDDFIWEMYQLGFDNVLTSVYNDSVSCDEEEV
jgi:hypothetical protein